MQPVCDILCAQYHRDFLTFRNAAASLRWHIRHDLRVCPTIRSRNLDRLHRRADTLCSHTRQAQTDLESARRQDHWALHNPLRGKLLDRNHFLADRGISRRQGPVTVGKLKGVAATIRLLKNASTLPPTFSRMRARSSRLSANCRSRISEGYACSSLSLPKSPSGLNLLYLCGVLATDVVPGWLKRTRRDQAGNDRSDVQGRVDIPLVSGRSVDGEDEGSDQAARRS